MTQRLFSQFGFFFLSLQSFAQAPNAYPQHYFANPLKAPMQLAANFGEMRPNHFHMGLDIRTGGRENLPVMAAAEGYIARVKVEPFGFGQAIYINHPNGYSTVYAHLNSFLPALAAYVRQAQYSRESWAISLDLPPGRFRVHKGDIIGWSGNTGGSQGPHLHFEIRSTVPDMNLNPLLFGLPVPDNTRPQISRLAIYDAGISVYEQSPIIYNLKNAGSQWRTGRDTLLLPYPRISLAIGASDTQSGSANPNGIYAAELVADGKMQLRFVLDRISYQYTRNINGHIDYKTRAQGGPWLQQLFLLPGLKHSIYEVLNGRGGIDLSDGLTHTLSIQVMDAYGNTSYCTQLVRFNGRPGARPVVAGRMFYPGMLEPVEQENCSYVIGQACLFDSAHIEYAASPSSDKESVSAIHAIGDSYIPLADFITVNIRPTRKLSGPEQQRIVMQRSAGKDRELHKVEWQGDRAQASFHDFGYFQLLLDTLAPVIRLLGTHKKGSPSAVEIVFEVKDNLDEVKNVRATLNGRWLLFSNDKGKTFHYRPDEHWPPPLRGQKQQLAIEAEDEAGNRAKASFTLVF